MADARNNELPLIPGTYVVMEDNDRYDINDYSSETDAAEAMRDAIEDGANAERMWVAYVEMQEHPELMFCCGGESVWVVRLPKCRQQKKSKKSKTMRIWAHGKWEPVEIGQRVFIGRCGGVRNVYGEFGHLERTTTKHAVFVSDSGSVVKTAVDILDRVSGGFKDRYFVSLNTDRIEGVDYMHEQPSYWNEKKCELCYK